MKEGPMPMDITIQRTKVLRIMEEWTVPQKSGYLGLITLKSVLDSVSSVLNLLKRTLARMRVTRTNGIKFLKKTGVIYSGLFLPCMML